MHDILDLPLSAVDSFAAVNRLLVLMLGWKFPREVNVFIWYVLVVFDMNMPILSPSSLII